MHDPTYISRGFAAVRPYVYGYPDLALLLTEVLGAVELERFEYPNGGAHVEMRIDDSVIVLELMETAIPDATKGSIYVYVDDVDGAYRRALNAGAKSIAEPSDKPYQERSAGFTDSFGNIWWIATFLPTRARS